MTHPPKSRWFVLRTRIALFAIFVQALIPFVLAAEIARAEADTLPICSATNQATDSSNSGPAGSHHRSGGLAACPICTALHASPAFTSPGIVPVPALGSALSLIRRHTTQFAPEPAFAASYRSRAPPVG
jgi:Protein of unknown function (DUF2946)